MPAKGKGKYASLGLGPMQVRNDKGHQSSPIRLYRIWTHMLERARKTPNVIKKAPTYLDLDTTVCDEWKNFGNFYLWAIKHGYRDDLSIDRINNFKGYYPANCRWATQSQQNKNSRMTPKRREACLRNLLKARAAQIAALRAELEACRG